MNRAVVIAERLTRVFTVGEDIVKAVDEVNLVIENSDFIAIMGPSGSGKTTLLNLIGCLDHPSGGRIFFESADVSLLKEKKRDALRLRKIGFVFQTFNLLPTLTALENVMLPMMLAGMALSRRESQARELLSWVGLSHREKHYPRQLSSGESQRVAVARSLANQPHLILADEPTGNLDTRNKEEIVALLKRVNSEYGTAILLVTHDPGVARAAGKLFQMTDGRITPV